MKKLMVTVAALAAFLLLATAPASAFDADYHVKQAPNNNGDLLFFPMYYSQDDGYWTKMTVVNTSDKISQVAKVVVRSRAWSEELIDFLIYLSPNDMWTGYMQYIPNPPTGRSPVTVYSEDDSVITRLAPPIEVVEADFASPNNPFSFRLFEVTCPGDSSTRGYVEIIGSRAGVCTANSGYQGLEGDDLLCKNPDGVVPKARIYKWYHGPDATSPLGVAPDAIDNGPRNVMAGWLDLASPQRDRVATMRAEAFADWHNLADLTVADLSGIQLPSENTIAELEAAMAKANIAMPYVNYRGTRTYHIFNFPTKLSLENSASSCLTGVAPERGYVAWDESPYFKKMVTRCERIITNTYDMKENTPKTTGDPISGGIDEITKICDELEILEVTRKFDIPYDEGWVRYNFQNTGALKDGLTENNNVIEYYGTPVLPAIVKMQYGGMSMFKAAYDDGSVAIDGVEQLYYQYSQGERSPWWTNNNGQ